MVKQQQKLEKRNTYTPLGASQAQCSVTMSLNKEETLSEHGLKTFSNNPDVNKLRKQKQNLSVSVYVVNMRGKPLMPTTPRKARMLLHHNKAEVIKRTPFTIQLKYATGETKQQIDLNIDAGYSFIGFSALTKNKELMSGELTLRKNISTLLEGRRGARRLKRNKLWYRKPRFLNRGNAKELGRLMPSIKHRLESHIRLIEKIKQVLQITKTTIEVATFDTQKMQNPEITSIEYQQGELQGYEIREYLLEKWGRKCAYCNKKEIPLEVEHIIPKSRKGTNRVSNLTISCRTCNQKKGNKTAEEFGYPKLQKQAKQSLKATAFMNNIRQRIVDILSCNYTYGYVTKHNRIKLGLEKSHVNDAFAISGNTQERTLPFNVTQTRRNNRCLQRNRKGFKPSIRKQRYKLQPNDLVKYAGKDYRTKGIFNYGSWVRLENGTNTNVKNVELICYGKGIQFETG